MSRIDAGLRAPQKLITPTGDNDLLVRPESGSRGFLEFRDSEEHITVRLLEDDIPRPKQSSATGILLGTTDDGPECILTVECHARIPGAQKKNPFDDLFHLNTFVDRWNVNTGRSLKVVGLYRFANQSQESLTHQDLTALKCIERQSTLIFMLIEAAELECSLRLFAVRRGGIVASWVRQDTAIENLLKEGQKSLSAFGKPMIALPPASSELQRPGRTLLSRNWLYSIGIAGLITLTILGFFGVKATRGVSSSDENADVKLRLAREGADWRLSWDPDSPILRNATVGRLRIVDGGLEKKLDLDNADLKGGAILYSAATNDLLFRLQVETSDSSKTVVQSVRAVDNLVSVPSSALFTAEPEVTVRPVGSLTNSVNPAASSLAKTSVVSFSRPNTLKMRTPPLSSPSPTPPEIPMSTLQASPPPDSLGAVLSAAASGTPFSPTGNREAAFEPAQLTLRREPIYPTEANGIDGAVKLQFLITNAGIVRNVKIISGNPILGAAAKAAVEMWRYKPASQSGTPIQTEGLAVITFNRHPGSP